jgi:pilus assembly protein CpaD
MREGKKRVASTSLALSAAALLLAGCSSMRPTQMAFAPDEYDQRHPIKIAEQLHHLDLFSNGRRLDSRQQNDVYEFGREFAQRGRGAIHVAVPGGTGSDLGGIRAALAQGGARAPLQITHYQSDPHAGAAPIRLSFVKLQAQVASQCGLWPADLAGNQNAEAWHNRPYHNLGCAYQTMLATQVADPVDLVRPRAEGPIDVARRTQDIEALRKDKDPSTQWRKDDVKVKESKE